MSCFKNIVNGMAIAAVALCIAGCFSDKDDKTDISKDNHSAVVASAEPEKAEPARQEAAATEPEKAEPAQKETAATESEKEKPNYFIMSQRLVREAAYNAWKTDDVSARVDKMHEADDFVVVYGHFTVGGNNFRHSYVCQWVTGTDQLSYMGIDGTEIFNANKN